MYTYVELNMVTIYTRRTLMYQQERLYYPIKNAAEMLGCDVDYLIHLASIGFSEICIKHVGNVDEEGDDGEFLWYGFLNQSEIEKEFDKVKKHDEEITRLKTSYETKLTSVVLYIDCKRSENGEADAISSDFSHLHGVIKIPSDIIFDIERELNSGEVCDINSASIPKTNLKYKGRLLDFESSFAIDNGLEFRWYKPLAITVEDLIITHEEFKRLKLSGFPTYENMVGISSSSNIVHEKSFDNPKTLALVPVLTRGLLSLIPNVGDIDVDSTSSEKIKDLIEAEAAAQGVEFPDIHHQSIAKYFGKKPARK